jgi:hypothetical protein
MNNAVLTKDNLLKRKWVGSPTCYFCDKDETVSHLFFQCSTAKAVWAIVAQCLGATNVPMTFGKVGSGVNIGFPVANNFMRLE